MRITDAGYDGYDGWIELLLGVDIRPTVSSLRV